MILTVPLQPGTTLSNVRYRWIAGGLPGAEQSSGISQPNADFPVFRFDVAPPDEAEEMIVYDSTDTGNWNLAQYSLALTKRAASGVVSWLQ
ncbi:MAG TPA: hypothetical protein VGM62_13885 [Chthoniobacterales bacterium]